MYTYLYLYKSTCAEITGCSSGIEFLYFWKRRPLKASPGVSWVAEEWLVYKESSFRHVLIHLKLSRQFGGCEGGREQSLSDPCKCHQSPTSQVVSFFLCQAFLAGVPVSLEDVLKHINTHTHTHTVVDRFAVRSELMILTYISMQMKSLDHIAWTHSLCYRMYMYFIQHTVDTHFLLWYSTSGLDLSFLYN